MCKRSARFILSCIQSESSLVRSIVRFGIFAGRCNSVIGKNTQFLCSHFGWQLDDFVCGKINLGNFSFLSSFYSNVSYNDTYDAQFLTELIGVRDSEYQVLFSDNSNLSPSELGSILLSVATSRS